MKILNGPLLLKGAPYLSLNERGKLGGAKHMLLERKYGRQEQTSGH